MSETIASALISILPQLFIVLVGVIFATAYRHSIGRFVSQRVTSLSALGFSLGISAEAVDRAVVARAPGQVALMSAASGGVGGGEQIANRWERLSPHLAGRTILWADDQLSANVTERRLLRRMGLFVEPVLTNDEALRILRDTDESIGVVISDIDRGAGPDGLQLLRDMSGLPNRPPLIFYVARLDPERGTPPNAFAITNRPDQLLNYVMDALDRVPPTQTKK